MGSDRSPMRAREDYVKVIYQLGDGEPVKAADVARYLGVSRVSVSKAKHALERDGFLEKRTSTDRLRLTRSGRKLAVSIVRRHRLLETFLHRLLAIPLERVHAEAERMEHTISEDIALRLAQLLGHPERDPHGHRIPYGDDDACSDRLPPLTSVEVGTRVRVISLDDRSDEAVRSLVVAGIRPGLVVTVESRDALVVRIRWGNHRTALLLAHAAALRIVAAP
jgi:DtxR family Mn-dependent transcriptional regulator